MAAFRGVHLYMLFNFAIYSQILYSTAGETGNTTECNKPWFASLDENLTISWTGEDRDAIVTVVIIATDVYDRNCNSSATLSENFAIRFVRLSNPCSNSLYTVTITLKCDNILFNHQDLTIRTPPVVPDPPELEILKKTSTSIFVKWTLSNIYRGPDPSYSLQWREKNTDGKHYKADVYQTSKEGQFNITSLKPFTTYEIQIRARNDAGFGRWSEILETDTLTGIPSIPRNLRVSSKSATHVTLTWDVPQPANGIIRYYHVQWRQNSRYKMWRFDAPTDNSNFVTADVLTPYTDYNFTIRARTEAGWGDWTPFLTVKTDVDIPSVPLELAVTKVTSTSLHVNWLVPEFKNGPNLSYVIQWMEINNSEYSDDDVTNVTSRLNTLKSKDVNTTAYEIRNLNPYTNYSIQVCAKTSAGRGNFTAPIIIQTSAGLPSTPTALEIIKIESTCLTLQWSAPEFTNGPLKGYVIHWGVKETKGSYFRTTSTSYDALGLRPYTEYFFSVAAETEGGQGNRTTVYTLTEISTPGVPRNLMASSVKDDYILVVWTIPEHPNAPFVQYTVMWNMVSDEASTQVLETNATAWRIRELEPDKNYSIRVRASSTAGTGPWTETLYVRTEQKDHSSAVISGSVIGSLLLLAIVCAILYVFAKRNGGLKDIMHYRSKPEVTSSETSQWTALIPLETVCDSGKVSIENFNAHVLELMSNGYSKLAQEFEKLGNESPAFPAKEAIKSENIMKIRWLEILPFDYSRVKLRAVGDEVEPDFINASFVPGNSHLLEYIATQEPLPNTVNDFWRMVWQESVFLIVMLTQWTERSKKTCEKYWLPNGSMNVNIVSESITPTYIQRLFLVTQDGKQRHVVHLHYTNWPVSGCPNSPDDFLTFVKTVRSQVACSVTGPMLVHCSDGNGLTGTFIAVDRLIQKIARECDEIDIYGTVLNMRRFRANLVQTEGQYRFIYLCLQRIIQEKMENIDADYGGGMHLN